MENRFNPRNLPALPAGAFPSPIPIDTPIQQAAIADIADLAALASDREFADQRITTAADQVTARQAADAISRTIGRRFDTQQLDPAELGPGLRAPFAWLEATGHHVDTQALHRRYPEVNWHSYVDWLAFERPRLSAICPQEHATVS
jgi:hypothetical protein